MFPGLSGFVRRTLDGRGNALNSIRVQDRCRKGQLAILTFGQASDRNQAPAPESG
jgi:hypothetical protein